MKHTKKHYSRAIFSLFWMSVTVKPLLHIPKMPYFLTPPPPPLLPDARPFSYFVLLWIRPCIVCNNMHRGKSTQNEAVSIHTLFKYKCFNTAINFWDNTVTNMISSFEICTLCFIILYRPKGQIVL